MITSEYTLYITMGIQIHLHGIYWSIYFFLLNDSAQSDTTRLFQLIGDASLCNVTILEATYIVTLDIFLQWFDIVGRLRQSAIEIAPALQLLP